MLDDLKADNSIKFSELTREILVSGALRELDFWVGFGRNANT